jgi:hypothetical protein
MSRVIAMMIAVVILTAGTVHAQDVNWQEKMGQSCADTLGYAACDNLGKKPPGPPPGIWGAIAFSTATFQSGFSWGQQNAQAAGNAAASECYRVMNAMRDCPVVGSFANACAALATSPKEAAWGYGGPVGNVRQATQNAIDRCQKGGGHSCTVVASLCSPGGPQDAPDVFAAIAISDVLPLAWGVTWDENSKAAANTAALKYCREYGGQQCKVQMLAWNTCVALAAADDGKWAVTSNTRKTDAGNEALQMCRNNNFKNCIVKVTACASDPR